MNYRHAYHAGNFADVAKHLALVSALVHLRRKEKPFAVIDTHGGRGSYNLTAEAARRTGEADAGIARLRALAGERSIPDLLRTYLEVVSADGDDYYPGSPLIAARLLRAQDRLVAIEKHPEDAAALAEVLEHFQKATAVAGDGYRRLAALLPPPERRGLILIDPPYEAPDEFRLAASMLADAWRRFATGIFMLWFPVKSQTAADAFCGEVLAAGITRALRIDIAVAPPPKDEKERMHAAGLLVINPPFGLDTEMRAAAQTIAPHLEARLDVLWLAGVET